MPELGCRARTHPQLCHELPRPTGKEDARRHSPIQFLAQQFIKSLSWPLACTLQRVTAASSGGLAQRSPAGRGSRTSGVIVQELGIKTLQPDLSPQPYSLLAENPAPAPLHTAPAAPRHLSTPSNSGGCVLARLVCR